jgi:hypothetical protein
MPASPGELPIECEPAHGVPAPASSSSDGTASALDACFMEMLRHYRASGGLARESEVLHRLAQHGRTLDVIARRDLIWFQWGGDNWIPLFQFDKDMSIRPESARVVTELLPVFDGWEIAVWFVTRNSWLADRRPVSALASSWSDVLAAARCDRFVAAG